MNAEPSTDGSVELPKTTIVAGLVFDDDGRLLTVDNIKHGVRIEPFGGKVKPHETPEQAVIREAEEELGIIVEVIGQLAMQTTDTPEGAFEVRMLICRIISGEPTLGLEPDKIGGFDWRTVENLRALKEESGQEGKPVLVPNLQKAIDEIATYIQHLSADAR
jgi:8-oxo-dGTP pyrophosphatase MutT (NUDIX family)